ncbi:hypothetical protein [Shewanella insulae]|uniref:hypothetical protein n=1 Tax=Shewanella insulae TaxID=2681496 RepID=UPI002480224F|nr:hypothetical protein [Shewanella insulae]
MKFENEYKELVKQFWSVGPLGKLVLVLLFFLSVSSITSLSDVVFKWKGFILGAINIYQEYFVFSLTKIALYLNMSYSESEINTAVFMSISVSVGMRMLMVGQKVAFKKINERYNSDLVPSLTVYKVIMWFFPIAIWLWYGVTVQTPKFWFTALVFVFYPVFLVVPKVLMSKFDSENESYWEKGEFNYFKVYYSYVGAIILFVCVLGAINAGITRTA